MTFLKSVIETLFNRRNNCDFYPTSVTMDDRLNALLRALIKKFLTSLIENIETNIENYLSLLMLLLLMGINVFNAHLNNETAMQGICDLFLRMFAAWLADGNINAPVTFSTSDEEELKELLQSSSSSSSSSSSKKK